MKKIAFWATGGLALAIGCGLAGLAHLSATLVTLTAFCTASALVGHLGEWLSHLASRMRDRMPVAVSDRDLTGDRR